MYDTQEVEVTFNFKNSAGTRIVPLGTVSYKVVNASAVEVSGFDLFPDATDTKVVVAGKGAASPVGSVYVRATADAYGFFIQSPAIQVSRDPSVPVGGDATIGTPVPRRA